MYRVLAKPMLIELKKIEGRPTGHRKLIFGPISKRLTYLESS
jgi:hypothetical protein